ncbi:hypothetical protein BC831DRAFT_228372 [Entophlyctis helioformis]|nr:hypothetical protein BC831DRAFT_228372 [Entophlyctis helioformis]
MASPRPCTSTILKYLRAKHFASWLLVSTIWRMRLGISWSPNAISIEHSCSMLFSSGVSVLASKLRVRSPSSLNDRGRPVETVSCSIASLSSLVFFLSLLVVCATGPTAHAGRSGSRRATRSSSESAVPCWSLDGPIATPESTCTKAALSLFSLLSCSAASSPVSSSVSRMVVTSMAAVVVVVVAAEWWCGGGGGGGGDGGGCDGGGGGGWWLWL